MGGGHGDHGHKLAIPDYRTYKVESIPELMTVQRALAAKGLKDPWLRNEVWKYDLSKRGGTPFQIIKKTAGRGMGIGFVAALITTAIGAAMNAGSHGHGDDHGHH